jgi:hypothetical protein
VPADNLRGEGSLARLLFAHQHDEATQGPAFLLQQVTKRKGGHRQAQDPHHVFAASKDLTGKLLQRLIGDSAEHRIERTVVGFFLSHEIPLEKVSWVLAQLT